jgi:hypothetical protein
MYIYSTKQTFSVSSGASKIFGDDIRYVYADMPHRYGHCCSLVVEQPVAELDGVDLLEPVLRDPAAGLGVPHPERVLVARRPPTTIRRAAVRRRPPHGGGSGALNVHRSRVHAVASLAPPIQAQHAKVTAK